MGNDPQFAAEMAALSAARRERERDRTGDGMAITTTGWMGFDGPRVPVPRDRNRVDGDDPATLPSRRHIHDGCLEPVAGGTNLVAKARADGKLEDEVPEPGWVICTLTGIRYHMHGEFRMAHGSRDRSRCAPIPTAVPS